MQVSLLIEKGAVSLKTKFIYVILSTALITTLTFLLSYFYTSQYYVLLLYIGYLVILASFTMVLVSTDSKPVVLLAVLATFMLLRILPRLSNIFSGYALAPGDEGYDLSTALITLHNGRLVYEKINGHNVEYINYPMLHIFTSVFTQIAGVDPIVILVALPQMISATILLFFVSNTSYSEISKFKLSLVLSTAFLLAGVHAQYWSTLVREAYASLFSTLLLLNIFTTFMNNTSVKILILILTSVALVFSHYALNVYTISAIAIMLLLVPFLMRYFKSFGVSGKRDKIMPLFIILAISNAIYILYNGFLTTYTFNWLSTLMREILYYPITVPQVVLTIGSRLQLFERIAIYIHYIALLSLLLLPIIIFRRLSLGVRVFLTLLVILYYTSLYARFIPGQGRYPLMRFAYCFLFLYIVIIASLLKHLEINVSKRVIVIYTFLFSLLALGYLAQVSPLFKYADHRLSIDPQNVMGFLTTYAGCRFNMGYVVIKPYMAINNYAFVLLDAHNTICVGIEYFQYVLNGSYILGNAKGPLNILVISPKYEGLPEQALSLDLVYSAGDLLLIMV